MISVILTILLLPAALLAAMLVATWDRRPRGYAATKEVDFRRIKLPHGPAPGSSLPPRPSVPPPTPPLPSGIIPWSADPAISERVDWP